MNYKIIAIPSFAKDLKILSKKHQSIKSNLENLLDNLSTNPFQGINLGNNCYKIRLAITSKQKGKSGGSRVIFNIVITDFTIYLLTIFDKSEKENLTNKELKQLLKDINQT